ncbi:hypothetical protein [Bradyrhizobium ottawaense]|uniref:hypothetical protein n=1 Tax=Bradyrhizobium ottawaense TaxID=931866 RepID=UPI0027E7643A|nr:hypothetical protein BwSF21_56330 [Bradyrhizobium ottawaense]
MANPPKQADDPRFHKKLFGSLTDFNEVMPPCLTYVENNNFNCGYDLLAADYKMAADAMIEQYRESGFGNWIAPVTFMVRQTLELSHKSLLEETGRAGNTAAAKVMFSHNLKNLWASSRDWLLQASYPIQNDKRFVVVEWMTANFHAVDPSGDLFRFAYSTVAAFGRQKTYDRAGVYLGPLTEYFASTFAFLMHWGSVLNAQKMKADDPEWEPSWDPGEYPKIAASTWRWAP